MSNSYTRSAVGLANTLQQYGYGIATAYGQLLKDSFAGDSQIPYAERRQAQKALGTMLMTQVATAGALGLPFAAATLAALEQVFGIPADQAVREGLASLGEDNDQGAVFAETALNGLGNQLFGIDVSSRMGVSNLLGTSSYRGFNLTDLAGPLPSIATNVVKGLNLFSSGDGAAGMKALVPAAFKNTVEMSNSQAKYGDYGMRDNAGALMHQASNGEALGYMMGFRPADLSRKRVAQSLMKDADRRASERVASEQGALADQMLRGNSMPAMMYAQNLQASDPTVNPQDVLRSIVQRGVDRVTEKDLLATGGRASEGERQRIAGTFPAGVVTRQSEVQRAMLAQQLGGTVGLVQNRNAMAKAQLVDMLVQSQGMPRSQAVRLAAFLD
jgi:hypothetical protein